MTASLQDLLAQHAHGAVTLEALLARVRVLADADTAHLQALIGQVQSEAAAGRITPVVAKSVLATLTNADGRTLIAADPTLAQIQATLVRSSAPRAADDATQAQRPAPSSEDDRTVAERDPTLAARGDPDATQASGERTERQALDASARNQSGPDDATQRQAVAPTLRDAADPTVRIGNPPPTAARTLRSPHDPSDLASSPVTRDAADRTEVIADRLVKSLDNVEDVHHGQLQPGTVLKKRFVLDALIGKGGMGLVFSAIDRRKEEARDPNPRVALKVLNADFQRHPQSLIALQREARKAQTLAHPNVVTVFDFDRDGDAVYMTMELLKGRALEGFVKEARGKGIDPSLALPIIRGIAEGLAYAHRKGIVHSDLKPGNIFVLEDGTPKILDFGIARAVPNSASAEAPDVFDAGMLGAYTEAYATDEMVEGVDPHPADDMYSLGIIAYELLTGFHPYQRHSAPKARKLGVKPPPLKGLKLREARALERCLSFDRKQRPQDAAEFLKLFRGVTALQKALLVATVVLTVAAGYLSYANYVESGPAIALSSLPVNLQEKIRGHLRDADEVWALYEREKNPGQLVDALVSYSEAYSKHPRNRDAARGLKKVADAYLDSAKDADERRRFAQILLEHNDYYSRYAPVADAAE